MLYRVKKYIWFSLSRFTCCIRSFFFYDYSLVKLVKHVPLLCGGRWSLIKLSLKAVSFSEKWLAGGLNGQPTHCRVTLTSTLIMIHRLLCFREQNVLEIKKLIIAPSWFSLNQANSLGSEWLYEFWISLLEDERNDEKSLSVFHNLDLTTDHRTTHEHPFQSMHVVQSITDHTDHYESLQWKNCPKRQALQTKANI